MRKVDSTGIHACESMLGTASSLRLKQHKSVGISEPLEKVDFSVLQIVRFFCFSHDFIATLFSHVTKKLSKFLKTLNFIFLARVKTSSTVLISNYSSRNPITP